MGFRGLGVSGVQGLGFRGYVGRWIRNTTNADAENPTLLRWRTKAPVLSRFGVPAEI